MRPETIAAKIANQSDQEVIHTVATFLYDNLATVINHCHDPWLFPTCDGYGHCPDCGEDPDPARTARIKLARDMQDRLANYVIYCRRHAGPYSSIEPPVITLTKDVLTHLATRQRMTPVEFARIIATKYWKRYCHQITDLRRLPTRTELTIILSGRRLKK